ncbi:MAG: hypothetical protein WCK17_10585 [Verrucomicrobiota bacterium]
MKISPYVVEAYFNASGITAPIPEYRFHPERKWRFDYAWPEKMIAIEVEGGVWVGGRHTSGSGFVKDMEKYNAATCLGWRLLRVQPKDLLTKHTVEMLHSCMLHK